MNTGYPQAAAARKQRDATRLKQIKQLSQTSLIDILDGLDADFLKPIFAKADLIDFILQNGSNQEIISYLKTCQP